MFIETEKAKEIASYYCGANTYMYNVVIPYLLAVAKAMRSALEQFSM